MAITDILVSIGQVAKAIYDQVQVAKTNETQCETLSQRVMIVIAAAQKLGEQKNTEHYRPALEDLRHCLEECLVFIKGFVVEDSWFMKVVQASSHEDQFKVFTERLFKAAQLLDLGLSAQQLIDQVRDAEDRKRDAALLLQKQTEIAAFIQQGNQKQILLQRMLEQQAQQMQSMKKYIKAQYTLTMGQKLSAEFITSSHEITYDSPKIQLAPGVYCAIWREQKVAVKKIEGALTEEDTAEFLKELDRMSRLHSPNVVALYAACVPPEMPCLIMEYMAQGSLYAHLGIQNVFTAEQKIKIALEVATGLHYLHAQNQTHRDLNSSKILLDEHGIAKLSNFGLSQRISSIQSLRPIPQGLEWQAPECLSKKSITQASDIYSFGIILWELHSKQRPYAGKTQRKLVNFVLAGGRESLQGFNDPIARIIEACWAERPEDRLTAEELIKQLSIEMHACHESIIEPVLLPNAELLYQNGLIWEQSKEWVKAFEAYREAAILGEVRANTNCAFCYLKGQGTEMDKQKAYDLFLQSAEAGHARAMVNLAGMLVKGDGIAEDPQKALCWYAEAAKLGDLTAKMKSTELEQKLGISLVAPDEMKESTETVERRAQCSP